MTLDEDFDIPETGAIFTFGKSRFAENTPSKFWIKNDIICGVTCGDEHTAVVTGSGRVFTIGNNGNGQLGLENKRPVTRPSCVKERIVRIACGRGHTLAATENGSVYSWGCNGEGQLGTGDHNDRDKPHKIFKLSSAPMQMAAGSSHSLLLTDKGDVFVWGSNNEGQLGIDGGDKLAPTKMILGSKISQIACGYYHSLAVTEEGQVLAWGEPEQGKLGLSEELLGFHRLPQPVKMEEKTIMVAAGSIHTLVLTDSGRLLSCGGGASGQLGQGGKSIAQSTLKPVAEVKNVRFVYISAGDNHSAAISDDGLLYTWGCGRHGKLCLGEQNFSSQFVPVLVNRIRHLNAVQVSCGGCHTMVLGYRRPEEGIKRRNSLLLSKSSHSLLIKVPAIPNQNRLFDVIQRELPANPAVEPTAPAADLLEEETVLGGQVEDSQPKQGNFMKITGDDEPVRIETDDREFSRSQKKASRFARFFGSLKRKKTSVVTYDCANSNAEIDRPPVDHQEVIDGKEKEDVESSEILNRSAFSEKKSSIHRDSIKPSDLPQIEAVSDDLQKDFIPTAEKIFNKTSGKAFVKEPKLTKSTTCALL